MPGSTGPPGLTDAWMHVLAAWLAPIALTLLPTAAASERAALTPDSGQTAESTAGLDPAHQQPFSTFFGSYRAPAQGQVRVTQRVTIRITARRQDATENLSAELPRPPVRTHLEEHKMGDCVSVGDIAAVDPGPENRLILYMRDRTLISAALDKECSAREFYSGFYIERTGDGKLCVKRDKLQSRSGASCEVKRLSRLISVQG